MLATAQRNLYINYLKFLLHISITLPRFNAKFDTLELELLKITELYKEHLFSFCTR
jgi:hypothetical protein